MNTKKNKTWIGLSILTLTWSVSSVAREPVNFKKVNPLLQAIADQVIRGDNLVMTAYPKFDTRESSFEREKIKYDLEAELKKTPWKIADKAKLNASARFESIHDPLNPGVKTSMASSIKLDALAFYRYAARVARDSSSGHGRFEGAILELMNRTENLQNIDELHGILSDSNALARDIVLDKLQREQDYKERLLREVPVNQQEVERAEATIQEWKDVQTAYASVQISKTADGVVIASSNPAGFMARTRTRPQAKSLRLVLGMQKVSAEITVFVSVKEPKLQTLKHKLISTLRRVKKGDPSARADIDTAYRQALIDFKDVVEGRTPY